MRVGLLASIRCSNRMKKRFIKRGLSTVVTGAIMLSAVSIMGTTMLSWTNSNLFSHLKTLDSSFSDKNNRLNEFLMIENVWFKQNSKAIDITVNNVGTIGLNVTKITFTENTTLKVISFNVPVLPHGTYETQIPYQWTLGSPIKISITTARGSIFTTQAMP